ncbi:MAG: helix-turn-helix transcriptional regulator [Bdellovibrionales bacterium]|nr:helix-turn-helix domain-containing protein [Bdellovibrionales bacterium]NQZ18855.1 helix-turn-helix transcriptional regulator [Bdellovibrionales bacterium]
MHSHLAKMLGQYILEKRNKLGILQKELAEETGISAQFLGRIERGDVMVPEPVLL